LRREVAVLSAHSHGQRQIHAAVFSYDNRENSDIFGAVIGGFDASENIRWHRDVSCADELFIGAVTAAAIQ
jgi:hypothetical protein